MISILTCCRINKIDYLEIYRKPDNRVVSGNNENQTINELYLNNRANLKNNYPFYVINIKAPLYLTRPNEKMSLPDDYIILQFGDVVFPLEEKNPVRCFFYVKTIDNKYGWIYSGSGISVNYDEDPNLFFLSDRSTDIFSAYIDRYKKSDGLIDSSSKIILAKNIVPLLLGNFSTAGWFYPLDYDLALTISLNCTEIAQNVKHYFYSGSDLSYWQSDEVIISYNLLADSYQKLKFYLKAEEVHDLIIRRYFWQKSYNSEIGGLTSYIKLEQIYLDQLKNKKINSLEYNELKEKIVENILKVCNDNKYFGWTAKDKDWKGLTFSEWLLNILRERLTIEEFYDFCRIIIKRSELEGFIDFVSLYVAVEMLREGKNEDEALKVLSSYKPKHTFKTDLRIDEWLSENKIVPDSVLYQYKF